MSIALRNAAVAHPTEEEDLLQEAANIEQVIISTFQFRCFDDPRIAITLLLPSMAAYSSLHANYCFKANILMSSEFLGMCLKHNIKAPFGCMPVLNPLMSLLYGYSTEGVQPYVLRGALVVFHDNTATKYIYELFWNARSSPVFMLLLEGAAKTFMLILVAYVSTKEYGLNKPGGYNGNTSEILLMLMMCSALLAEYGQLYDFCVRDGSFLRGSWGYFSEIWNRLDIVSYLLLFGWAVLTHPNPGENDEVEFNRERTSRIFLSVSAIPLSLSLFQYLSIVKSFGRLVIMILAMLDDLLNFLLVFVVALVGFGITLNGMFLEELTGEFRGWGRTFMTLFAALMGGVDYTSFPASTEGSTVWDMPANSTLIWYNSDVQYVGIATYISFVVFIGIMIMNLLIARMASTHDRIDSASRSEWAFVTVRMYVA